VGTSPVWVGGRGVSVSPAYLAGWGSVTAETVTPVGTTERVQVTDGSGTALPDAVLPGNSAGFASFPVALTSVATTTYPSLALKALLTTSSASSTPEVLAWSLSYDRGPVPLPNIAFTLTGAKTIGSTGAGAAIYKTIASDTTGSESVVTKQMEWDVYALTLSGYDVVEACSAPPFTLAPGSTSDNRLTLGPSTANMVLISVRDDLGAVVPGASVTLSRTGYSATTVTGACGTAYFGSLTSSTAYTVQVSKTGYTTQTYTPVTVSGKTFYAAPIE